MSQLDVPIIVNDRVVGLISLDDSENEYAFSDSDVRLLTTVAASVGVAIENARLFGEIQRRRRESEALAEVGRDLSSTLDLPTVLEARRPQCPGSARRRFQRHLPARRRRRRYRAATVLGADAAEISATVIRDGVGIIGHIIDSGARRLRERHGRG